MIMDNFMPGEWEIQNPVFVGAKNKNRLAEALRRQSAMPQGQMVGDRFVAPSITQYLASGLNQYRANQLENEANQSVQDAYANRQRMMQEAASRYAEALAPKQVQIGEQKLPYEPSQMDRFGSPIAPQTTQPIMGTKSPSIEDMLRAQMLYAQQTQDPRLLQNVGNSMLQYGISQQQREDTQAFQNKQAEENRAQRMQEILLQLQDKQIGREKEERLRKELAQMQIDTRFAIANMAQANKSEPTPYYQALPTAQGYARFNARTGQLEPIQLGGGSVLPAAQDPSLQANITTAKETAKSNVEMGVERTKNIKKSDQLLNAAKQAESLLKSGPTGSGIGSLVDAGGRLIGQSTKGSQLASQLETLSGWMVSNVPRMEGPQSNYDVQNYMTMAGKVGDRTVPVAERLKSLEELVRLQEKYKALNQEPISNIPAGAVRRK